VTYSIITLGCRVNQYESEALAECLENEGYFPCFENTIADLYVINTCAVTAESEKKSRQAVRRCIRENPNALIIVCGCSSQINPDVYEEISGVNIVWGCRNKSEIISLLKNASKDKVLIGNLDNQCNISKTAINKFDRVRAYVKIEDGCNGKCAYCIIATARGNAISREENDILNEINELAKAGCKEVVLTGVETGAYKPSLSELIKKVNEIEGIERIRLGSMDPVCITEDFLREVSTCKKFMPHLHLSLQSGSTGVLNRMKRKYTAQMAEKTIENIKKYYPNANITADMICGFPGESEEEFNETLAFVSKIDFLHIHIFPYSNRKGTVADKMDGQLPSSVKDLRCKKLDKLVAESKKKILEKFVKNNEITRVLIETFENNISTGHTENFIEARISCPMDLRGQIVSIKVIGENESARNCWNIRVCVEEWSMIHKWISNIRMKWDTNVGSNQILCCI